MEIWDKIVDAAGDAVDWLEDKARDLFENSVLGRAKEFVDTHIWDATENEANLERLIKDIVDQDRHDTEDSVSRIIPEIEGAVNLRLWDAEDREAYLDVVADQISKDTEDKARREWDKVESAINDTLPPEPPGIPDWLTDIWDNISGVLPELPIKPGSLLNPLNNIAFEPLAWIFKSIEDSVASRINGFIANAMGIEIEE